MFVRPEKIIDILNPMPGETVADFGCGSGHYVIEAARRVGKYGKVYGIDIQQNMLSFVRSQANLEHLNNIETIWADLELPDATRLKENSVNIIIVSNILFQAENKEQVVKEAFRILKPGGRVAAIEWDIEKQPVNFGPAMTSRISSADTKGLFEKLGFVLEKEFNPGENHYGLIFVKSEARNPKS
jgi:ubiquinone/menaquinone biosynthesis C-methylase UbiE